MAFVTPISSKVSSIPNYRMVLLVAVLLISRPLSAGSLSFSSINFVVAENSPTATIFVTRTGSTAAAASVTVVSSDGTAKAGSDYTAVSQLLTWGIGDSATKSVTITLKDDALIEGNESFSLSLSSPVGDGTSGDSTVTLTDYEEGKLQFSSANFVGIEGSLKVIARINRNSGTAGAATVKLKTTAGAPEASDQSDYTSLDTTVSFSDGEAYKDVMVTLKDDNVAEFSEFLKLTLSSPTGATLGAIVEANAEIKDDDEDFTSTLKLLNKSTTNVTLPQQIDLTQNSLLDPQKKIIDLINTIPILTLTELEAEADTEGLMTIDVETDRLYVRPVAIKRSAASLTPSVVQLDDQSASFITSQGWSLETQPALAKKGMTVLQKGLAAIFLPDLEITKDGNITVQVDQGAPPFERDVLDNVIVNYSFYDRWNLRPSMISSEINSSEEGYSLIPNPFVKGEVIVSVIYQDGTKYRQQVLTTAPINGPELLSTLNTKGLNRCVVISGVCLVNITRSKQGSGGQVVFETPYLSAGKKLEITIFSDYKIRKVPNFTSNMVGFYEVNDKNGDGSADYQMIYSNGEAQYFFFVSSQIK